MILLEQIVSGLGVFLVLVVGRRAHTALRGWGRTILAYHRMTNYEIVKLRADLARSEARMAKGLDAVRSRADGLDLRLSNHEARSHRP